MKKLFILALAAVMMAGCCNESSKPTYVDGWMIVVIDSCEYLNTGYKLAHKGNCKFCAERRRAEIRELLRKIKEK